MPLFIVSGFFALFAFSLWYKGNSMCGTALGMASNGMYSFWGPFFCWIILGVFCKMEGWGLPPIAWVAAILMAFGIMLIALNPLDLFKKDESMKEVNENAKALKPLNFAILKHFTTVDEACAEDVMDALKVEYADFKALKRSAVIEALMTAETNGLLRETRFAEDESGHLRIYYEAHEEGKDTINKYIKD
jgi:endonuclease/exonuclease/phosphatase (EEP) superfamily protein YafD